MNRSLLVLISAVVQFNCFCGCSYIRNRVGDASDMQMLGVEIGHIPFSFSAKISVINIGLGPFGGITTLGHGDNSGGLGYGMCWRTGPKLYAFSSSGYLAWGKHYIFYNDPDEGTAIGDGYSLFISDTITRRISDASINSADAEMWQNNRIYILFGTEISGGVILGLRAGLNPYEIFDFILGIFEIDISGDDDRQKQKKPVDVDAHKADETPRPTP